MEMEDPGSDQEIADISCNSGAACAFSEQGREAFSFPSLDITCLIPAGRLWRLSRHKVGQGDQILIKKGLFRGSQNRIRLLQKK